MLRHLPKNPSKIIRIYDIKLDYFSWGKYFLHSCKFVFSCDCEIVRFVRISECGVAAYFGNPSCVSYLAKHACPDQYFTCRWLNLKYLKIFAIFRRYGWSNTKSSMYYAKVLKILHFESLFYRHLISDLDRSRPTFGQKNWQVWSPKNGKKIRYTFEYFCTFFSFLKPKKFSSLNHFFSSSYDCTSISYFNLENL